MFLYCKKKIIVEYVINNGRKQLNVNIQFHYPLVVILDSENVSPCMYLFATPKIFHIKVVYILMRLYFVMYIFCMIGSFRENP
jgi:hypothetical protein